MLTPAAEASKLADLTQCEHEPIHVPGAVQSHGVLIVLNEPTLTIVQISDNCGGVFGFSASEIVGRPLSDFFEADFYPTLEEKLLAPNLKELNPLRINLMLGGKWHSYNGIAHRTKQALILELEPARLRDYDAFLGFYQPARSAISRLREAKSLIELANISATEVQKLTGFDRVVIYAFDESWNGQVIAEKLSRNIDSYLDLHFPASDIPRQARELYTLNWSRFIPDVNYKEARLFPRIHPQTEKPLDLSFATLRSVSPVHREYLQNMECSASMSISLMKEGKLWGLISCTHLEGPKFLPFEVRTVCEFLGEVTSSFLSVHEQSENFEDKIRARSIHAILLERMTRGPDFARALLGDRPNLMDLTNATGAAVCFAGQVHVVGDAPSDEEIHSLVEWVSHQTTSDGIFATNQLASLYPPAEFFKEQAAGLIAAPLSQGKQNFVLWFRSEVVQTVNWGGNPTKAMVVDDQSMRLHPRKSFELWKETVRLRSVPWLSHEVDAALALQKSIMEVVLQQSEELLKLNLELKRSNTELDSFAYAASHDLKEPLRGIHNYAAYIKREAGEVLPETSAKRLDTVIRLSQRMESLINSLLHYAQVGRTDLSFRETDLHEILDQVVEGLRHRFDEAGVTLDVPRRLPRARCDRIRIAEVFANLLGNAVKYNERPDKRIEVGFEERAGEPTVYYVRDNGIGIKPEFFDSVFKIFRRLHQRDRFGGGTGIGLTITKRIVERHNGRIWISSKDGAGTTFYFTLDGEEPLADT